MVTRQQAQEKWARNFAARLSTMAANMGDEDEYARGVANYLGISGVNSASDLVNNAPSDAEDAVQAIVDSFSSNADMSASEIRQEVVAGTDANSFDEAVSELASKWDSNYAAAFGAQ